MPFTLEQAQKDLQIFHQTVLTDAQKFREEQQLPAMDEAALLEQLRQARELGAGLTKKESDSMTKEQQYFYAMALVQEQLETQIRTLGGELPRQMRPADVAGTPPPEGTPQLTSRIASTVQRSFVDERVAARLQQYISERSAQQEAQQQSQMEQYAQVIHTNPMWFRRKDSQEMESLLGTLSQLTQKQWEALPGSEDDVLTEATVQEQLYQNLIEQCNHYLEGHTDPKTTAGKTRRQQVENIRMQCLQDIRGLVFNAAELARLGVKATWGDVQAISREISLTEEVEKATIAQQETAFMAGFREKVEQITDQRERYRLMRRILLWRTEKLEEDSPWFGQLLEENSQLTPSQIRAAVQAYYQEHPSDFLWEKEEQSHTFENVKYQDGESPQEAHRDGATVEMLGEKQSTVIKISFLEEGGKKTSMFFKGHDSRDALLDSDQIKNLELTADERKSVFEMIDKALEMVPFNKETFCEMAKTALQCEQTKKSAVLDALFLPLSTLRGKRLAAKGNADTAHIKNDTEKGINMRNVMTSIMAKMLHVPELIAKSHAAKLTLDGKEQHGILMEEAHGKSMAVIDRDAPYDEDLLRQIQNLQLLDFICAQLDRHMDNYFVQSDETGKLVKITGIDNDLSFGALTTEQFQSLEYLTHACPCMDEKGKLRNFERMDPQFVQAVMNLSETEIDFFLSSYLAAEERSALLDRITALQKALLEYIGSDENGNLDLNSARFKEGSYRSDYRERAGL